MDKRLAALDEKRRHAESQRKKAEAKIVGEELSDGSILLAKKRLPIDSELAADALPEAESRARAGVEDKLERSFARVAEAERRLVSLMERGDRTCGFGATARGFTRPEVRCESGEGEVRGRA